MDTFQGKMNTISPAIGPYDIDIFMDIDKLSTETGGITGMGTLEPVNWYMGVTGMSESNFKNASHGF